MTALMIGIIGTIVGAGSGSAATYFATRSTMRVELEYAYDRATRDKRLECYQELFRTTKCLPRYWLPDEAPSIDHLKSFREDFHNWYFGERAGGMFLTPLAKDAYLRMLNALVECIHSSTVSGGHASVSDEQSRTMRSCAGELRHQLAEDIGAGQPPRLRWTRLGATLAPPPGISN